MSTEKELTPAELAVKEAKDAKKAARKALVNDSKNIVAKYFDAMDEDAVAELPQALIDAVAVITAVKAKREKGAGKPSAASAILIKLKEEGRVSDVDLFMKFKVAQREMAGYIRNWIKKPSKVEDRAWVMFDKDSDEYVLVGEGELAPENWDGYVPATATL